METDLILPSGEEKLLERVKRLKEQLEIKKKDEKLKKEQQRYVAYYQESRVRLAEKWFSIASSESLPKDELEALDHLIYRRSIKFLIIYGIFYLPVACYFFKLFDCWNDFKVLTYLIGRRYVRKQISENEEVGSGN